MPGPLGDATRRDLTDAAVERLAAAGFEVDRPETGAEPPAVATRGDDRLAVEPLAADDATPIVIASRLGHALDRGRRALFVARDADTAAAVRDLLADPPLLAERTDGRRTFHLGPDRVPVSGGGYACVRADGLGHPTFGWRETDTPLGPVTARSDVDAAAVDDEGRPVVPRLLCEVDGEAVAVLAGVDSLQTPPDEAFPFAYRRDPDDKRFRVRRGGDGTVVETVSGFAALREAGYVPIPMPLVPEHALGRSIDGETLTAAWDLLVIGEGESVDDGSVGDGAIGDTALDAERDRDR
ncbi:hypothetical protein [Halorubrum ezzemoulense]|uniref:hypothetical protein n=1 Tax=Halorubrum ezzemoulense TaxID=337243 RepID=UPI002331347C|nr:hypothetical protein [Halorubrum ezzemoulense]MDB2281963.1 hypothetical protein [Halorubrum ezzemoulense]MDB9252380.1 hypothetical protein [Halorubrum ezzemoulense]MDB9255014.1 hypothetical protein [Halorubrum ezzemoulense]MDB9275725.1 hypothetical protein [Halorubrum ezzemoulense]